MTISQDSDDHDEDARKESVVAIARQALDEGNCEAALEAQARLGDWYVDRVTILVQCAIENSRAGQPEGAARLIAEARRLAELIECHWQKADQQRIVGLSLLDMGDRRSAVEQFLSGAETALRGEKDAIDGGNVQDTIDCANSAKQIAFSIGRIGECALASEIASRIRMNSRREVCQLGLVKICRNNA